MSKLQSFKRIIAEDFDEKDRSLVSKLSYSINVFAEDVLNAFNSNLSIEDNLNIAKKEITIALDRTGKIVGNASIKTGLNHICDGLIVIKVDNLTTPTQYPSSTPLISFTEVSGIITINNITNLAPSTQQKLKLLLF